MGNERKVSLREFADQFYGQVAEDIVDIFNETLEISFESVVSGSEITGSKGIPVDTGAAKNSVIKEKTGKLRARIRATGEGKNTDGEVVETGYLIHLEENLRGITWPGEGRSKVGGPHFFQTTHDNLDKVVPEAVKRVLGQSDHDHWSRRLGRG